MSRGPYLLLLPGWWLKALCYGFLILFSTFQPLLLLLLLHVSNNPTFMGAGHELLILQSACRSSAIWKCRTHLLLVLELSVLF
jgi:hypothetical protein